MHDASVSFTVYCIENYLVTKEPAHIRVVRYGKKDVRVLPVLNEYIGDILCFIDHASLNYLVNTSKSYAHIHTYKTSHSSNSIIYVRILLRFYHLHVSDTLHFMT